jgi:hypothetical protein
MYERDIIPMNNQSSPVDTVWQAANTLSTEEKAELVERLLGQESGLIVISATSHLADYIIAQTNLLSRTGLAYVWRAIANRMIGEEHEPWG